MDEIKLTKAEEQQLEDALPRYFERGLATGLSSEPADRPRAERAALAFYAQEGLGVPECHWALSPEQACRELAEHKLSPVWFKANQNLNWLMFYLMVREVLGRYEETEDMMCLLELAESCGWVSQNAGHVWLLERPKRWLNEAGRLHNPTGPAVLYPDGHAQYCLAGVQVPSIWVTSPDTMDMRTVLTEQNAEVRSAGIAHFGWGRLLAAFPKRRVIDSDPRLHMGTLIQVDLPQAPKSRLLVVSCPTGRQDALMVPPTCKTALQAQAWVDRATEEEVLAMVART